MRSNLSPRSGNLQGAACMHIWPSAWTAESIGVCCSCTRKGCCVWLGGTQARQAKDEDQGGQAKQGRNKTCKVEDQPHWSWRMWASNFCPHPRQGDRVLLAGAEHLAIPCSLPAAQRLASSTYHHLDKKTQQSRCPFYLQCNLGWPEKEAKHPSSCPPVSQSIMQHSLHSDQLHTSFSPCVFLFIMTYMQCVSLAHLMM